MVHGLASNARLWDGVAGHLVAAGHPVAAIDQRGHGQSSKPDSGYNFGTLTDDLVAVIAALGWDAPVVAGQSWGGDVVLELAARHPSSIAGLVLVDGGILELSARFADWPTCAAALAPPPLAGTPATDFERTIRSSHPDWPETGIEGTMANMEVLADGTVRPWLSRDNHMRILRRMWEHHPPAVYPDVKVPVRIIVAEDRSNQRWMAGKRDDVALAVATLARAEAHWIAGDHDLHAQHPSVVADLVRTLVA
jgi:pimeloyl-ACP methyl ester carboxylesterase